MLNNKNNSISLYRPIGDIFDAVEKHLDTLGQFSFTPTLFSSIFDDIVFPDFQTHVSYPVSNCYIEEDGSCIIEIAVTGFSKEEIDISLKDNVITIEGKKDKDEKDKKRKYLFRKLSERSFRVSYELSDKLDTEKINTSLENGLLIIEIPMKEIERKKKEVRKITIK